MVIGACNNGNAPPGILPNYPDNIGGYLVIPLCIPRRERLARRPAR
jgi:hypothetical protein